MNRIIVRGIKNNYKIYDNIKMIIFNLEGCLITNRNVFNSYNFNSLDLNIGRINLIDNRIPYLLNKLKNQDIRICLTSFLEPEYQNQIINKFYLKDLIDDFVLKDYSSIDHIDTLTVNRLMKRNRVYNPNNIIKVGDTRKDIIDGYFSGCLSSIGVLSGEESKEKIKKVNPDLIIKNIYSIDTIDDFTDEGKFYSLDINDIYYLSMLNC